MPAKIAYVVDRGLASLYELQTFLGGEDLVNLVEIGMVRDANQYLMAERSRNGNNR